MNGVAFDELRWLHLLWAVVALVALGLLALWQRHRALQRFAGAPLASRLVSGGSWTRPLFRLALQASALALLVVALVGPRWGEATQTLTRRNVDVWVLLDVSRSMLARDLAPSRLERAKLAIRDDLLPALGGERIGLIAFAGRPALTCPLTLDYGFFRLALDDVSPRSVPLGGTAIGDAIRMAADLIREDPLDTHRLVILITDGEDHESFPVEAATNLWRDHRVPVVALALGDPGEGTRIPLGNNDFLEFQGAVVRSRADFTILEQVARVSPQGLFLPVGTSNFDLGALYHNVASATRALESVEDQRVAQPPRGHLFAAAALLLLLLDSLVRDRGRAAPWAQALRPARENAA